MAPDVKIRDLDPETYNRLRERARENDRSMEAELRKIVADAVGTGGVRSEDWESAGFEQVDEIVPERLYEVWADATCYRVGITRAVVSNSSIKWNSRIDMLHALDPFGSEESSRQTWIRPTGIPQRLLGDTAEMALRDAIRWLSDYAGVSTMKRALSDKFPSAD